MRISDWSSDVCSSDLFLQDRHPHEGGDPVTLDADDRAQATSMDSRLRGNDEEARFAVAVAPLDDGFALDAEAAGGIPFAILTERQLFPERASQPRRRRRAGRAPDAIIRDLGELSAGSPPVHEDPTGRPAWREKVCH